MKTLVICSGGMDSVTLAHEVAATRILSGLISFNYGQRHKKELEFAKLCAEKFAVPHVLIDISDIGRHLSGSALTDDVQVPEGHYAEESMRITVVPNRNAIMLTIACGMAAAQGVGSVAAAFHGGDHYIYPDCRPEFVKAFGVMQKAAMDGLASVELFTPYLSMTKSEIAAHGEVYGVDFAQTWSCYQGGEIHCGRCGTCVERREAFHLAGLEDPTLYQDAEYWRGAVEKARAGGHRSCM